MIPYNKTPLKILHINGKNIAVFGAEAQENIDQETVDSFSYEWEEYANFSIDEIDKIGNEYFDIINSDHLNKKTTVLDLGCGTGRWSLYIADKVKFIEAVDPSNAVVSASNLLYEKSNVRITKASIDSLPFDDESFDFVFSLGVLHHIPDTKKALQKLVKKVKLNGHVLIYLYYNLDNKSFVYKSIFRIVDKIRKVISKRTNKQKLILTNLIAYIIYLPMITLARIVKIFTKSDFYKRIPLSYYLNKSLQVIKNDAFDRFGTPLEQRFSKTEIESMMKEVGLGSIKFSPHAPYWHVVGIREK